MAQITLYHAAPSRSSIVHWMLEERLAGLGGFFEPVGNVLVLVTLHLNSVAAIRPIVIAPVA